MVFFIDWWRVIVSRAKQISPEVLWRLKTLVTVGGHSAYDLFFIPNPVDLFGRDDKDEDMLITQDA